jgi:two-component system, chemotaxis family, response regulator WspF
MRIAIADASEVRSQALRRFLEADSHQIAWRARGCADVLKKMIDDRPDLLLLDIELSANAVEITRRIVDSHACPILLIASVLDEQKAPVFAAIAAGAVDAVSVPLSHDPGAPDTMEPLRARLRTIARLTRHEKKGNGTPAVRSLLVIGASAGGPQALAQVLSALPPHFKPATAIVQHLDANYALQMASWLATQCQLPVRTAEHGEALSRGTVLLAGTSQHLVLTSSGKLAYTPHPEDCLHKPSIDVFFESVASHWKGRLAGVVLTGMGRDGASGLKRLRDRGALTIAQDQATSAIYGMPKAAVDAEGAQEVLPLRDIGARLVKFFRTLPCEK